MDYEPGNHQQRHCGGKAWEFTFVGETPTKLNQRSNNQGKLRMQQVFPLSTTKVGDRLVITQIHSERSMVHHLNNMGLTVGCKVQVISKTTSGSVIICIQDKEIGLGIAMADRVIVAFAIESS